MTLTHFFVYTFSYLVPRRALMALRICFRLKMSNWHQFYGANLTFSIDVLGARYRT